MVSGRPEIPISVHRETELEAASPRAAQERRETDDAPFREVERLKENSLHHFEPGAKRLEYLYLRLVPIHLRISNLREELIKLAFRADRLTSDQLTTNPQSDDPYVNKQRATHF